MKIVQGTLFAIILLTCPGYSLGKSDNFLKNSSVPDETIQEFMKSLQTDVNQALSTKQWDKLDAALQSAQVPDFENWFVGTFGVENGRTMAETYSEKLMEWEENIKNSIRSNGDASGQMILRETYGDLQRPNAPESKTIDNAIRTNLTHAAVFCALAYEGKKANGETFSTTFGYATLINGRFRLVPEIAMQKLPGMSAVGKPN